MNQPLDELYLDWLYKEIANPGVRPRAQSFWNLARLMYTKPFIWFIPNDDNRVADGQYLRVEFSQDLDLYDVDPHWLSLECSFLELLVGLARHLEFLGDGTVRGWFWEMVDNLEIRYSDQDRINPSHVNDVMDRVISRTYRANGVGGLFPLRHPDCDQREAELWYQLNAYLNER